MSGAAVRVDSSALRAALVGCGRIGAFTRPDLWDRLGPNWLPLSHADALANCPGIELVGVCDPDAGARDRAGDTFGVPHRYADHRRMLDELDVDLLAVATRSDVRPAILIDAARAGVRGVHTEKPLALSLAGALEAIDALTSAGTSFSYGAVRRYMPIFHRARSLIVDGHVGDLHTVTVRFGLGGLLWTHPHSVDLLCHLAGDPGVDSVQSTLRLGRDDVDGRRVGSDPEVLSAAVHFDNGVVGQIVAEGGLSVDVGGSDGGLSVIGDGVYLLHRTHGLAAECRAPETWRFEPDAAQVSGRLRAISELRDTVLTGAPERLSLAQVGEQHRILFAMLQSHLEGGRRVALDEVDSGLVVAGPAGGSPP